MGDLIFSAGNNFSLLTGLMSFQIFLLVGHLTNWASRGGVLQYMGHIGMCRCEGYGFHAVHSGIG